MIGSVENIRLKNMKQQGFGTEAMKKVKVCMVCGTASDTCNLFCMYCGNRLPEKNLYEIYKERHKTCAYCQLVVNKDMDFCPQCGKKIKGYNKEEI